MRNNTIEARGFTLIELITAMAVTMVVLGALYSVFTMQNRTISIQEQIAEMQQNARTGMESMMRDIRMAGYNPTKATAWGSGTQPGLTVATTNCLGFVADLNANGDTAATSSNAEENIAYERYDDGGVSCLGRTANGTRETATENIESLTFAYYDQAGNTLSMPVTLANVRKIEVAITAKTSLPDSAYSDPTYSDHYRRYRLTFAVTPRNLGL